MRYILFSILPLLLFSSVKNIEHKIIKNKNKLKITKDKKQLTQKKINTLVFMIQNYEKELKDINYEIKTIENDISLNKFKLKKAKKDLQQLLKDENKLSNQISELKKLIIDLITKKQALILNKKYIQKESIDDVIKEEVFDKMLQNIKSKITSLNINYLASINRKRKNKIKQDTLKEYIEKQNEKKIKLASLKSKRENKIKQLNKSKKVYQEKLTKLVEAQLQINNLLSQLNILKIKEEKKKKKLSKLSFDIKEKSLKENKVVKKQKAIKIKSKNEFKKEITQKVKIYSNTTKGIKISNYKSKKAIPPLKNYTIYKKFGKYYDKLYNIELFNDGVIFKSKKKNAKVYNMSTGRVVYSKYNAGILGNVVIIENKKDKLHFIYTKLSQISPEIKKGAVVRIGKVIGRIKDKLSVQVMKNNRYLDPMKLIR